jgi:hypothetical protein
MERMRLVALILVLGAGLGTGCNKKTSAPAASPSSKYTQDAIAAGGTLNSDGSVTNANGSVTEPNGNVLPASANPANAGSSAAANSSSAAANSSSASANSSSAPAAAQPVAANHPAPIERVAPPVVTAPAGTPVTIRTTEEISSKGDEVGQRFNGVLERPVVSHGTVIFERGTPVAGEVVGEKNKGEFKGAGHLAIVLTSIGKEPVKTSEYVQIDKGRGKRTGAFIGGGGGLGALIGGLAGGGKGALIGGLAGAGAGTVGSTTGSKDVIIRPESVITFRLRAPVSR